MKVTSKIIPAAVGLLTILLANYSPSARAGWSVSVGLTGSGTVKLKVSNACGSNVLTTPFMLFPSAAFNRQSNTFVFLTNAPAPACSTNGTYVQVRASTNYVTSIQSATGAGDTNDSDEVLQFVIPRSACASGDVDVVPINITANAVTFHYTAKLSDEGSAALFRIVDSVTGQQRYVVLIVGPYDNTTNSCEGTFTVIGDPARLNLLVDGNTSTLPFDIACPGDIVLPCDAPPLTTYDPPAVPHGVTGPFTVTYVPAPSELVFGVTNTVIATARDTNGCTVKCQFNVYRQPISFDGFYSPIGGADGTGGNADWVEVRAGSTATLADIHGAGSIRHIWFTINSPSPFHLRELVLRMYWDGETEPSVEVPIGDFFGTGFEYEDVPGGHRGQIETEWKTLRRSSQIWMHRAQCVARASAGGARVPAQGRLPARRGRFPQCALGRAAER